MRACPSTTARAFGVRAACSAISSGSSPAPAVRRFMPAPCLDWGTGGFGGGSEGAGVPHAAAQAQRAHVRPHLADVRQAVRLRALGALGAPAGGQVPGRPARWSTAPLIDHDAVDRSSDISSSFVVTECIAGQASGMKSGVDSPRPRSRAVFRTSRGHRDVKDAEPERREHHRPVRTGPHRLRAGDQLPMLASTKSRPPVSCSARCRGRGVRLPAHMVRVVRPRCGCPGSSRC